jgi:hypothetical protein
MYSESVCQVARSWVEVGSFHTRLVVGFMISAASVRNILNSHMYRVYLYKEEGSVLCSWWVHLKFL